MTKQEALIELKNGKKLTHRFFSNDEWIMQRLNGDYEFEDGNVCKPENFWTYRKDSAWETGWNIYNQI